MLLISSHSLDIIPTHRPLTICRGITIRQPIIRAIPTIISLSLHLRLITPALSSRMFRVHGWDQIDEEREDVECEDECDGPFENCSCIVFVLEIGSAECDCEDHFDEDEGEFDPEGDPEDAVFSVSDS